MTKQEWLNEIDKAGKDVILVNNIVLAAGRDDEFHNEAEGKGFEYYSEVMNKGLEVIMKYATPEEMEQIHNDNLFAAKLALLNALFRHIGIGIDLFGDDDEH